MTVTIVGTTSHLNSHFGVGTGPIFIQQSSCSGLETSLLDCSTRYRPTYACNHYQDVGVTCGGTLCSSVSLSKCSCTVDWFDSDINPFIGNRSKAVERCSLYHLSTKLITLTYTSWP